MKKIIVTLSVLVVILLIANMNPSVVGNVTASVGGLLEDVSPIYTEGFTNQYRCSNNRILRDYRLKNGETIPRVFKVCNPGYDCVETGTQPKCQFIYEEPKFIQGSQAFGKSPQVAIDFSDSDFRRAGHPLTDIYITRAGRNLKVKAGATVPIKFVDKPVNEVTFQDCAEDLKPQNKVLLPGKSICITTKECCDSRSSLYYCDKIDKNNCNIAVIGGYWDGTIRKYDILDWKYWNNIEDPSLFLS
tara:strand:- start:125 stop:859 length:735 start_codon:yes stop_codon:yes gene_type:complete